MKDSAFLGFSPCSGVDILGNDGFQCTEGKLRKLAKRRPKAFYDCMLS